VFTTACLPQPNECRPHPLNNVPYGLVFMLFLHVQTDLPRNLRCVTASPTTSSPGTLHGSICVTAANAQGQSSPSDDKMKRCLKRDIDMPWRAQRPHAGHAPGDLKITNSVTAAQPYHLETMARKLASDISVSKVKGRWLEGQIWKPTYRLSTGREKTLEERITGFLHFANCPEF
jgi:hypothetical protein